MSGLTTSIRILDDEAKEIAYLLEQRETALAEHDDAQLKAIHDRLSELPLYVQYLRDSSAG